MEIVLAKNIDLEKIKMMYTKIIENMYINNITIWNDDYPIEDFEIDIENNNLYLIKENEIIIGAFVMEEHIVSDDIIKWKDKKAKAYVLNRVGVNVDYQRQGIGQMIVEEAKKIAKSKEAEYLRLMVCDVNTPAINLYLKCGFLRVDGVREERVRDDSSLFEHGFEMQLEQKSDANS